MPARGRQRRSTRQSHRREAQRVLRPCEERNRGDALRRQETEAAQPSRQPQLLIVASAVRLADAHKCVRDAQHLPIVLQRLHLSRGRRYRAEAISERRGGELGKRQLRSLLAEKREASKSHPRIGAGAAATHAQWRCR